MTERLNDHVLLRALSVLGTNVTNVLVPPVIKTQLSSPEQQQDSFPTVDFPLK